MTYTSEQREGFTLVRLKEQLSPEDIAQLRQVFWTAFTEHKSQTVAVELESDNILDPSAISLLSGAQNLANKEQSTLLICGGGTRTRALLEELNLITYFDYRESHYSP